MSRAAGIVVVLIVGTVVVAGAVLATRHGQGLCASAPATPGGAARSAAAANFDIHAPHALPDLLAHARLYPYAARRYLDHAKAFLKAASSENAGLEMARTMQRGLTGRGFVDVNGAMVMASDLSGLQSVFSRIHAAIRGVGAPRFQINFADNTTCHASWYFGPYAGTDQIYAARGRRARAEHFINIFNVSLPYNFPPVAPGAGAR